MARANKMKHLLRWTPLVLYGISATSAFEAEISTPPAWRDAPPFAVDGQPDPGGMVSRPDSHQTEKRQAGDTSPSELTPAQLAEWVAGLQLVYGQLSAFTEIRNTGLLNNLLGALSGVAPPLSDVVESLRLLLVGDRVTILEQLVAAEALGIHILTAVHTTTVTVGVGGAAKTVTVTLPGAAAQLPQSLPVLATGQPSTSPSGDSSLGASASSPGLPSPNPVTGPTAGLPSLPLPNLSAGLPEASIGASIGLPETSIGASIGASIGLLETFTAASVGASIPLSGGSVGNLPVPSLRLPSLSLPLVSLPSATVPDVSLPTLPLPSGSLPSVELPSLSIPWVSLPLVSLPSVSLPSGSLPPIPLPSASIPAISLPSATLPSVSLPRVSVPQVSAPEGTLPAASLPPVSVPSASGSAGSVSSAALPSASLPSEAIQSPLVSLPSISVPSEPVPAISLPSVSEPQVSAPRETLPASSLPGSVPPGPDSTVSLPSDAVPSLRPLPLIYVPGVSAPELPPVSSPSLAGTEDGVPSVSLPSVSLSLGTLPPNLVSGGPGPEISLSSVSDPAVSLTTPPGSLSSIAPPSVSIPGASPPGISLPSSLSVSGASPPSVALPPVSLPSISLAQSPTSGSSVSLPSLSLDVPSPPSLPVPSVSAPSPDPQVSSPSLAPNVPLEPLLPSLSPTSVALPVPPDPLVSSPPLSVSSAPSPSAPVPTLPLPNISIPGGTEPPSTLAIYPNVQSVPQLPSVSLPNIVPSSVPPISQIRGVPVPDASLTLSVRPSATLPPGIPDLLDQLSNLLVPLTSGRIPVPTPGLGETSPAVPSIPVQGFPTRSGIPACFQTSTIPAVSAAVGGVTAALGQPPNVGPLPTLDPTSIAGVIPNPVPSSLFDPRSSENVAVYFGPSDVSGRVRLLAQCADKNVDIVILGFLTHVTFGGSTYPRLQLSPVLPSTQTSQMLSAAPGLSFYATLEADIKQCQARYGKKILLSLGGAGNRLPLESDQDALSFANNLWELFGPMGKIDLGLRPFGSAVLDGFDLNKQDERAAHFDSLAATLRSHFAMDTTKDYFLSAAPGCSFPDVSIHPGYLAQSNFVWPRFYNDSRCEVGSAGFLDSVREWPRAIEDGIVPMRDSSAFRTRLYAGLPAAQGVKTTAFLGLGEIASLTSLMVQIKASMPMPTRLGGIMVSGGAQGLENMLDGLSLLGWVKAVLKALL